MSMLEKAIALAANAHAGQKDKAGYPYILHPLRVMLNMTTESEMIAAVLHDIVEDTQITSEELRRQGFSEDILDAVRLLTKQDKDKQDYLSYIGQIRQNPIARKVKLADLEDNMNIRRLKDQDYLNESDVARLKKYYQAWKIMKTF
ncbi:MAG: GTP pyrophosphokinase [Desulfobacteraceae bacterium IS3]|nr:MAG: GTP pyrophosphokinase [Desulfobacteraceae bacterium IS3]